MSAQKRLIFLTLNFLLFGSVYWGLGNTPYTVGVTYIYYALCLILSVLYVFVAGGLKSPPLMKTEKKKKKKEKKKIYHPVKQKEKYKAFKVEEKAKDGEKEEERELGPNLLHIPEEKRPIICHILLLIVLPLYVIFLLDWFYLKFFI